MTSLKDKYDISLKTQKLILQMCMAQWDGQWFLKLKKEQGSNKANELNQRVALSFGRIEAKHILNSLGIRKGTVKTIPEIFKIINTIMDVMIPKIMKFKFLIHSDYEGDGVVKKCFIWEEVKKAKGEKEHVCGCTFRHGGWLDSMGVNGEIIPVKRFCDGDDECVIKFKLNQ